MRVGHLFRHNMVIEWWTSREIQGVTGFSTSSERGAFQDAMTRAEKIKWNKKLGEKFSLVNPEGLSAEQMEKLRQDWKQFDSEV